jgi:uncharacterized protein YneF (UPF0154 family)
MKLLKIFLIIALLLTVVTSVSAFVGFFSGNKYMEFSENEKFHYVAGLIDMTIASTQVYHEEKYLKIKGTMENMTLGQIFKIFNKYLEENPEELHNGASYLFMLAINEIIYQE